MLSSAILFTPALKFTPLLNVNLGSSKLPYAVPAMTQNISRKRVEMVQP